MAQGRLDRVVIGLPVYNGEKYISQALDSLLAQDYGDFELFIRDNASTDKTEQICRMYARRDSRVVYYRNQENIGAVANFLAVLEQADSPYFMWAAFDDLWTPDYLSRSVGVLRQNPESGFVLNNVVLKSIRYHLWRRVPASRFAFVTHPNPDERFLAFVNQHVYSHKTNLLYALMRTQVLKAAVAKVGFMDGELLGAALLLDAPGASAPPGARFYKRYETKWPAMFIRKRISNEKRKAFEQHRDKRFERLKELAPHLELQLEFIRENYHPRTFRRNFLIVDDARLNVSEG